MKKIRGILVDTRKGISPTALEYEDYHDITELIGCQWVTCVTRNIGGLDLDVYCDEEALLKDVKEPAIISMSKGKIVEVLYGNCFLCLHNKKGEAKSIPHSKYDGILLAQADVQDKTGNCYRVLKADFR